MQATVTMADLYTTPCEHGFDEQEALIEPVAAVFRVWDRQIISSAYFVDEGAAHAYAKEMSVSFPAPYRFLVSRPKGGAVLGRYQDGQPFHRPA